jgi:hypothetical protein
MQAVLPPGRGSMNRAFAAVSDGGAKGERATDVNNVSLGVNSWTRDGVSGPRNSGSKRHKEKADFQNQDFPDRRADRSLYTCYQCGRGVDVMVDEPILSKRCRYVLERLQREFSSVQLSESFCSEEISAVKIQVSSREVVPWEYTPFVVLRFQEGIESILEKDFEDVVEQGVASIKRILQNPPVTDFSYQGDLCLGYTVRFEYQGPERRSGVDRRTTTAGRPSRPPAQDAPKGTATEQASDRRRRERRGGLLSEGRS